MSYSFITNRFLQDFTNFEIEENELIESDKEGKINKRTILLKIEQWKNVLLEDMIQTFRSEQMSAFNLLLFLQKNQDRYFTYSYQVKCPNKHRIFLDESESKHSDFFCPNCQETWSNPGRIHQHIAYTWKE